MHDHQRRLRAYAAAAAARPKAQAPTADVADGVATIRLYDPIDSWGEYWGVSAKELADTLDQLPVDVAEIRLHINSPGGDVFDGIAVLNALRAHKARVVAVVDGIAASAASFVAAGVDELLMAPNSELMIHDAWGVCVGNAADMRQMADLLDHVSNNIASIYAGKAGNDIATWRAAMARESWFSAQEAIDAGLADGIAAQEPADAAKNRLDLSLFTYAGRAAAPAPKVEPPADPAADAEFVSRDEFLELVAAMTADPAGSTPTAPPAPAGASDSTEPARSDTTHQLRTATLARQHAMTKETL